ncbi:MAG: hypothetical protein ACTSRK_00275 [Promethearchaeota archaeon]
MNYTELEVGTGQNVHNFANRIKKGLYFALIMIVGCIVVFLATENFQMIV